MRPIDDRTKDLLTQLCEFPILVSLTTSDPCNHSRDRFREHIKRAQTFSTRDATGDALMGVKCPGGEKRVVRGLE